MAEISSSNERNIYAKLEAIKDIKNKTIQLEKLKLRIVREVKIGDEEEKCLQEYRKEMELLLQEKMSHVEELRQIHADINEIPMDADGWKAVAALFRDVWNFPHCIGAIDGKLVNITKPPGSGSYYFDYKGNFSIVLMALANYEFLMVDVGINGRVSDGGVFKQTKFYEKLQNKTLIIPYPEPLPDFNENMPFVFVSDDAFPLTENIMKPYSHTTMKKEEIIFNYRLSRARRIVENAFGILASRFRILLRSINLNPEKVSTIVLACCHLHNYLRQKVDKVYCENGLDTEHTDRVDISFADWHNENSRLCNVNSTQARNPSNEAKNIRQKFCEYFNTTGEVPWQNKVYEKVVGKEFHLN